MIKEKIRSFNRSGWSAILKLLAGIKFLSIQSSSGIINKGSLIHGNLKRSFKIYSPLESNDNTLKPLVIVLHGRGGNGESMILLTRNGFNRLADEEGFIVLYPDGIELNWNDGRTDQKTDDRAHIENIDDVGFISLLLDLMIKDYGADPRKVYITGISNGAIMAYRVACELSGRIAAIAPVDGNMPQSLMTLCVPDYPVSVLAINGTHDPLVPYTGGDIRSGITRNFLGKVLSVDESIEFWAQSNNCLAISDEEVPTPKGNHDFRITRKSYLNPSTGTEVILYTIHGGGHTWPGGLQYMPERIIGKTCRDLDANRIIWSFFRKHSLKLQEALHGR